MAFSFNKFVQKTLEPVRLARSFFNVNVSGFYVLSGRTEKAIILNKYAQNTLKDKKGWEITKARCYNNLAKTQHNLGQYETAIKLFESARKLFKEKGKLIYVGLCDANMGHAYFELEHYKKALDYYLSAINILDNSGQKEYAANLKIALSDVYSNLNQYEKALKYNRSARGILATKIRWQTETAHCDITLAKIHTQHGWNKEALDSYLSARKIFFHLDNNLDVAKCDMDLAVTHLFLGQNELAFESYKSAETIFRTLNKEIELAEAELNMAKIYHGLFQFDKALQLIDTARKTFDNNRLYTQVALCDIETSNIYSKLGYFEKAIELNKSARKLLGTGQQIIHKKYPTENAIIICDFNAANIFFWTGQYNKALEQYEYIIEALTERGMEDEIINCNFNIACVNLFLNRHDMALKILENCRTIYADKGSKRDSDLCDLNVATAFLGLGNHKRALAYFQNVHNSEDPHLRAKSLFGVCKLYWEKGDTQLAKSYCESAIEEIENIRESTSQEDLRTSFIGTVFDFYYTMIEICIEINDHKSAFEYVERLKSRSLAEMLANRDMLPKNTTTGERQLYKQLRSKIRACSHQLSNAKNPNRIRILSEELKQLESDYERIVVSLKIKDVSFNPDFKTTTSYSEIAILIPDCYVSV